jgi:hypothetical protein
MSRRDHRIAAAARRAVAVERLPPRLPTSAIDAAPPAAPAQISPKAKPLAAAGACFVRHKYGAAGEMVNE